MKTILIADDNQAMRTMLDQYVRKQGYATLLAEDGEQALALFHHYPVDALLLDVMMPKLDGYAVCRAIRKTSTVPVIMITAKGEDGEKILGLDIGADDYIVKPAAMDVIMARIRAVLRRSIPQEKNTRFQSDGLEIDLQSFAVKINGIPVEMSHRAAEILWTLASRPRQIFTREILLDLLWGDDYAGDSRAVDSQIKRMRNLLSQIKDCPFEIKTVWGAGYQYEKKE